MAKFQPSNSTTKWFARTVLLLVSFIVFFNAEPNLSRRYLTEVENQLEENVTPPSEDEKLTSEEQIRQTMMDNIEDLPEPRWPQLDSNLQHLIANKGVIIGPPLTNNFATVVTAYYEFESKHSVSEYEEWFSNSLMIHDPMIIFVEPESSWFDFVISHRNNTAPTIVVPLAFDEITMSTTFTESFWEEQYEIDYSKEQHKGTGVYKIWNQKMVFMLAVSQVNPFGSDMFTWMDAGYFRYDDYEVSKPVSLVRYNLTAAGLPRCKMHFGQVHDVNTLMGGCCYSGTAEAIEIYYDSYFLTLWSMVLGGQFVGSDQFVMATACRNHPSNCQLYWPGRYNHYFSLKELYKNPALNISQQSTMWNPHPVPEGHYDDLPSPPADRPVTTAAQEEHAVSE